MADVSALYPQAPQPTQGLLTGNPMQLIGAIGALNQNQLFQQEFAARRALGTAYQNALTPDGTIDGPRLMKGVMSDPAAAWRAPEAAAGILSREGQQFTNAGLQADLVRKQTQTTADIIGSLPPESTPDHIISAGTLLAKRGIPSETVKQITDIILKDPKGVGHGLALAQNLANGAAATINRVPGPPSQGGQATSITAGQANTLGAPGQPTSSGPGFATTLPLGSEKSAAVMQDDLARARNFGQEITPWTQALGKLQELGPGGTGPGSKGRQEAESFLFALNPTIARWAGVDPNKIKNYAEAEKYLTQATQTRAAGFGAHTDMQLSTALTGNPNVHINEMAAEDVTKVAIALRRMEHVQTLANSQAGPVNYTDASAKWAAKQDPRAYMIDLMKSEQVAKLQNELKGAARDKFNASLRAAIENGVITPPGQ